MSPASFVRCFFGVELPRQARDSIAEAIENVRAVVSDPEAVRWISIDCLHLTLKFMGDVPSERIPDLARRSHAKLASTPRFDIALAGFGAFPNARRARVLWLGVATGARELARIARRLDSVAASFGVARDHRPYQAHFTLGRLGKPDLVSIERATPSPEIAFTVEEVLLYESRLGSSGATYVPLARLPLREHGEAGFDGFAPEI